jgi:hypothetical protein
MEDPAVSFFKVEDGVFLQDVGNHLPSYTVV